MSFIRACAATTTALIVTTSLSAGDVSGVFKVGKESIAPKYVTAYWVRDPDNPRNRVAEVVLSEAAYDPTFALSQLDPNVYTINDDALRNGKYILIRVSPDGTVVMNATITDSDGMRNYPGSRNGLKAELTPNRADKLEGRVFTPKPIAGEGGQRYEIDVKFSTSVLSQTEGEKLSGNGGEPFKAFEALLAAISEKDLDGIKKRLSEETLDSLFEDYLDDKENLASMLETFDIRLPKNMTFVGGHFTADTAILEIEGKRYEGGNGLFIVRMKKSGNDWVYDESVNTQYESSK